MVAPAPVYPGMTKNSVLAVLCGVVAMTVLDLSVVNVALPSIQRDLNVGLAYLQWVVVAYGVAVAGFLLVGGRLGDLLGHRRVLVIGVGVLMVASFAGGVSGTFGLLSRRGPGRASAPLSLPRTLSASCPGRSPRGRSATGRWGFSGPPGAPPRSADPSRAACSSRAPGGNGCSSSTCRSARR